MDIPVNPLKRTLLAAKACLLQLYTKNSKSMEVHKICSYFKDPLKPKTMETTLKRPWCGWQDNVFQLTSKFQLDENEHNVIRNTNSNHSQKDKVCRNDQLVKGTHA